MSKCCEMIFEGKILSKGISFGNPVFFDTNDFFKENTITKNDHEKEISKLRKAIKQSKKQIFHIKKSLAKDKLNITFDILNTHLEILNDPLINNEVETRIKKENKSIEAIFKNIILDYKNKIKDPFFKEKAIDIADVLKRILSNIRSIKLNVFNNYKTNSVILANEIIPSDIFEIDEKKISAFLCFTGSYESHAAIIARSKNIPFLSKINIEKLKQINFKEMIVDANVGRIIINPTKQTYEKYKKIKQSISIQEKINKRSKTKKLGRFYANISSKNEVDLITDKNICGIGLLRTELFFLDNKKVPDEETQFQAYKNIALKLKNLPFVIRFFDLGADKLFYNLSKNNICNFFGNRGISYLLKNKKILIQQIRAILRASSFGNVYILIPFVKNVEEILLVKKYILQIQKELNIEFLDIKLGCMIETPASALIIDEIIKNVDFISIGTNDLTRYTLASENFYSKQLHKSLIKLIQNVVETCKNKNKPVFLCGEMTKNKKILNKLISLGISNFSVSTKHLEI